MEACCNADGVCPICNKVPPASHVLICHGCTFPWHMACLRTPLHEAPQGEWLCPDCDMTNVNKFVDASDDNLLRSKIRAINADDSLTEEEKNRKRQELHTGTLLPCPQQDRPVEDKWTCVYCLKELDRPCTTPCGHNFCLSCLQTALRKNQKKCPKCRLGFGENYQPHINLSLVMGLRMSKTASRSSAPSRTVYMENENRPDQAFVSERAKKTGLANASSGKLFVHVHNDYFGPILEEHGNAVPVGQQWNSRMECRQYGVHLPHVSGIAGQSKHGSQSVVLSGGYEDDRDYGEYFIYTGSGGKDLSGNKRTNKTHSCHQTFTLYNQALRLSCKMGYPVRVVRSEKDFRSAYAPAETADGKTVRYDGIYRVEKCWRRKGMQGFLVCRFLFVRCDNEPAPWTSGTLGDRPREELPEPDELNEAIDITTRKGTPHWGWKEEEAAWGWLKTPPPSKMSGKGKRKGAKRNRASLEKQLKAREFQCDICKGVLELPVTTPCSHSYCQSCLVKSFEGQDVRKRGGRASLRVQKVVKRCRKCKNDITNFMVDPRVNIDLNNMIMDIKKRLEEAVEDVETAEVEEDMDDEESDSEDEDDEVEHESADDPEIVVSFDVDWTDPRSSEAPLTVDPTKIAEKLAEERAKNQKKSEETTVSAKNQKKSRSNRRSTIATSNDDDVEIVAASAEEVQRSKKRRRTTADAAAVTINKNKTAEEHAEIQTTPLTENRRAKHNKRKERQEVGEKSSKRKRIEKEIKQPREEKMWDVEKIEVKSRSLKRQKENAVKDEADDDLWEIKDKSKSRKRSCRAKPSSETIIID